MIATVGCIYILYIILSSSLEGVTDFVDRGDRTYSLLGGCAVWRLWAGMDWIYVLYGMFGDRHRYQDIFTLL